MVEGTGFYGFAYIDCGYVFLKVLEDMETAEELFNKSTLLTKHIMQFTFPSEEEMDIWVLLKTGDTRDNDDVNAIFKIQREIIRISLLKGAQDMHFDYDAPVAYYKAGAHHENEKVKELII